MAAQGPGRGTTRWPAARLPSALVGISITSVLVAPYGARLSHKLPVATLKRIFAVLLYVLGLRMLWGVLVA